MPITIELSERQRRLLDANASVRGVEPEEYALDAILARMEDEQDYRAAEAAYFEWLEDPVTFSHEEVMAELGLR